MITVLQIEWVCQSNRIRKDSLTALVRLIMNYNDFKNPKKPVIADNPQPDKLNSHQKETAVNEVTDGLYYHTWRNIIARESLAEKEDFNAESNPEKIDWTHPIKRYQDQNYIQCVQPLQVFRPLTLSGTSKYVSNENATKLDPVLGGLKGLINYAKTQGLKVKAVGTGHSFSDVATTSDFLVITDDLCEMLPPKNPEILRDIADKKFVEELKINHFPYLNSKIYESGYSGFIKSLRSVDDHSGSEKFYETFDEKLEVGLVEFEAGIKINQLNEKLWDLDWSLHNMGTYQGQSFIGAASTSTHGSGHNLPPFPDMIRSMVIVVDDGVTVRIEPTKGISQFGELISSIETMKLPKTSGLEGLIERKGISTTREPEVDYLIQDNDWFAASLVNVGTFGVVYSVIIEVVKAYYLLETVEFATWENIKNRILNAGSSLFKNDDLFALKPFTAHFPKSYGSDNFVDWLIDDNYEGKIEKTLELAEIRQTTIEIHPHKYAENQDNSDAKHHICRIIRQYKVEKSELDSKWINKNDKGRLLGEDSQFLMNMLNQATETVRHNKRERNKKYRTDVLLTATALLRPISGSFRGGVDAAHVFLQRKKMIRKIIESGSFVVNDSNYYVNRNYRTQVIPLFPGYGVELGFGSESTTGSSRDRPFILAIDKVLEMAEQHWTMGGYLQSSPIAMRFVKGSNAFLSPQYSNDCEPRCMLELLSQMDSHGSKELLYRYQRELFKFGARPHWGLDLSVTTGNNGLLENMYPKFSLWKQVHDTLNGYGTFNNRFTDRMGLS